MDIRQLKTYLEKTITDFPTILTQGDNEAKTGLRKLIRMYDYLRYNK